MKIIISAILFISAVLPLNANLVIFPGLTEVSAQTSQVPSRITQPLPAPQIKKVVPPKTVVNPGGRVIAPGKVTPPQTGQQTGQSQPGQSQQPVEPQQTMQQPQYQEQMQPMAQPMMYMDTTSTYPASPDQNYQQPVNQPIPDTTAGAADGGFTGVQSDIHRRTGGQGRGNVVPGQPVQQMPMQQQVIPQQGPMQPMPGQQDPQAMQPMPGQQMPMAAQPGMPGMCTIQISEDRSSIALLDGSGQEINHIALGRDRVQKVFKSPDGNWSVLVFKVRQRQEYGAIAVNIPQCDPQEAREIRAMPENIQFQGDAMQLLYSGNMTDTFSLIHKTGP